MKKVTNSINEVIIATKSFDQIFMKDEWNNSFTLCQKI